MTLQHLMLLLAALAGTTAHAGRPLATEDADVLERSSCEWESFAARVRTEGEPSSRGWATQAGCGIGFGTQVALGVGRDRSDGATTEGLLLGGKTRLVGRDGGGTGWTLAWGLAGARDEGRSFDHETTFLNLVATRELGDGLTGHANLGWLRSESADTDSTTWNLALEQALVAGVDLMGEVYGDDRSEAWLGLGLRWSVNGRFSLNGSWAHQGGTPSARLWTLGFKLAF